MASMLPGARLTERHRTAQLALRALALRQVLEIWPALDVNDAARSWPEVEAALMAVIGERRAVSASLSAGYFEAFRRAEGVGGVAAPVLTAFDEGAVARARTSLQVTGYFTIQRLRVLEHADPGRVRVSCASRAQSRATRSTADGRHFWHRCAATVALAAGRG